MKKALLIILSAALLLSCSAKKDQTAVPLDADKIAGEWSGTMKAGGQDLELAFHIKNDSGDLTAVMDSITQGVNGIIAEDVAINQTELKINFKSINAVYTASLSGTDTLEGSWKQGPGKYDLTLQRRRSALTAPMRPQDPSEPYPYKSEDVTFRNLKQDAVLAGTLTYPDSGKADYAIILISGSGSQDRNEELMNHRPFLVISDYLTREGIAVLRYDDRGFGESTGDAADATSADLATDADAAVNFMAQQDFVQVGKIGLAGHSEGGLIAPITANSNELVDFVILLAGPGVPGDKLLMSQSEAIMKAAGASEAAIKQTSEINRKVYDILLNETDDEIIKNQIIPLLQSAGLSEAQAEQQMQQLTSPWFKYFTAYNPEQELSRLSIPVLAVNGSLDLQVPAEENLTAIRKILEKSEKSDFTIKEFDGLNHLFQPAVKGLPSEYGSIEKTIAPEVLEYISSWIKTAL